MLASLPQGSADKKRKVATPMAGGEGEVAKTALQGTHICLKEIRHLKAQAEDAYLNKMENPVMKALDTAQTAWAANDPPTGPHPWGPQRWLLCAALSEVVMKNRRDNAEKFAEIQRFEPRANEYADGLLKLCEMVGKDPAGTLPLFKPIIQFLSFRKTKDGRGLMRVAFKVNRLSGAGSSTVGLFGVRPYEVYDVLRAGMEVLWGIAPEDGPGPAEPVERKCAALLKKK